ncbi:putative amino acid/polyamine transporter I [Helianthus annuus]|uniref:Amino acid/polyamine transporter I n=1 Tax=Helianthus annuus TaxID=4232 RepID=A0A251V0S1_HELAN|nr:putative amino acid/polyamine transporter I [Helianthus annuus]KAJ0758701.1 putative amino acid/polyamine transporter I [Helianthus annuus]
MTIVESTLVNKYYHDHYQGHPVTIVLVVIIIGAFEVDVSNWSPFAPNGSKSMLTGATVALFACVRFDLVANSAEECKRPQGDIPIGIIASLLVCVVLYIGVCLVITGMVPYKLLGEDAPLAEAFKSKGLNFVSVLISIRAIAGLTTTLLVGLYVQTGYSVVAACVMTLRWDDSQVSKRMEGIVHYRDCLLWFCCWNSIPL